MICHNCGQEIADSNTVCPHCGTAVSASAAPGAEPVAAQPASQPAAEPAQQPYAQQGNAQQPNPAPSFFYCVKLFFKNFVNFSGRSRRAEYWYWVLFRVVVQLVFGVLAGVLSALSYGSSVFAGIISAAFSLWALVCILPGLALNVRRLHDIGKSGVNILFGLIPIAGFIILLVWAVRDSNPEPNQYGESPKYTPGFSYEQPQQ